MGSIHALSFVRSWVINKNVTQWRRLKLWRSKEKTESRNRAGGSRRFWICRWPGAVPALTGLRLWSTTWTKLTSLPSHRPRDNYSTIFESRHEARLDCHCITTDHPSMVLSKPLTQLVAETPLPSASMLLGVLSHLGLSEVRSMYSGLGTSIAPMTYENESERYCCCCWGEWAGGAWCLNRVFSLLVISPSKAWVMSNTKAVLNTERFRATVFLCGYEVMGK